MEKSRAFYQDILGMKVVWAPDPLNVYLSLGSDNLALHQAPKPMEMLVSSGAMTFADPPRPTEAVRSPPPVGGLDHIGFIVACKEDVDFMAEQIGQSGVPIVKPVRLHRDGSYSFYIDDPDGNRIQILYEPHITLR